MGLVCWFIFFFGGFSVCNSLSLKGKHFLEIFWIVWKQAVLFGLCFELLYPYMLQLLQCYDLNSFYVEFFSLDYGTFFFLKLVTF